LQQQQLQQQQKQLYFVSHVHYSYYKANKYWIDIVDVFINNLILPIIILCVIFVTTAVTSYKLHQAARWRLSTSGDGRHDNIKG
jgi:uncharacterized membrane protein YkvI